jgi:serine/threonine protein kinase
MLHQQIHNYKIISKLGEGGMAIVYLAENQFSGNKVAMKILKDNFIKNNNIKNRFIAEAKSLAKISHPNVINVCDFIEEENIIAFVMEYISGPTLFELIDKKVKLKDLEIYEIFSQMLGALSFIHQKGFIHRDIKPSNFMVKSDGAIVLLDFGIAKHFEQLNGEYTATGTFHTMGTPNYMSLEQFSSSKNVTQTSDIYCNVTQTSDIYCLGLVLWFMITGKQPFSIAAEFDIVELLERKKKNISSTKTKWDSIIQPMTQPYVLNRLKTCNEVYKLLAKQKLLLNKSSFFSIHNKKSTKTNENVNEALKIFVQKSLRLISVILIIVFIRIILSYFK